MNKITRIAIITKDEHICAKYLVARLSTLNNVEILVINYNSKKVSGVSFCKRLLLKRGLIVCIDNFLRLALNNVVSKNQGADIPNFGSNPICFDKYWSSTYTNEWKLYQNNITIKSVTEVNSGDGLKIIRDNNPHIILLAGAPIVSDSVIKMAEYGILNAHQGITPDYAGNSPTIWSIYNNCKYDIGYTIHYVVPQVDSGPIIEQMRLPWCPDWSWNTINDYTGKIMYTRLASIVENWIMTETRPIGRIQRVKTTKPPAGYFVKLIAERNKMRLSKQLSHFIIPPEWSSESEKITNIIL